MLDWFTYVQVRAKLAAREPHKAYKLLMVRTFGSSLSPFRHNDFRRFIVLTRSRTGSNLLISFLNSHPQIYAESEIFSWLHGRDHREVLERVFAKQPLFIKAKGFKIFYYHPQDDDSGLVWQYLTAMPDLHIIHLKRTNILRTLVSRKIAAMADVWTARSSSEVKAQKKRPVHFSVEELREGFEQTRAWEIQSDAIFRDHPLLQVTYEELTAQPESAFRRVAAFLGVPYKPPRAALRKQNPESLRKLIANYDVLKAEFQDTEWASFFED